MTLRSSLTCVSLMALMAVAACDKRDPAAGLPDATGETAPARADIPTPDAKTVGSGAHETANHRWVGTAEAKHHVELAPGMTGIIAAISVEEGDTVKAGQQVFRIEGTEVKLAVSQAQAAVAAAELQLAEAERETERTRKLADRGTVGSANLERAEAGVEAAKAGVKQAKAAAALAKARTADLTVETPISGIVTRRMADPGEIATMMPPTIVLVIDDLSIIEVRVRVPELKLREIDVGSPVTVYFPALDLERQVPITRIGNAVDARSRTIELIIDVDNADLRIKSGMSVEVELGKRLQAAEADAVQPDQDQDQGQDQAEAEQPKATDTRGEVEAPTEPASPTAMIVAPSKSG